jgi:hypothetical protein
LSQSINGESGDQGSIDGGASWILFAVVLIALAGLLLSLTCGEPGRRFKKRTMYPRPLENHQQQSLQYAPPQRSTKSIREALFWHHVKE